MSHPQHRNLTLSRKPLISPSINLKALIPDHVPFLQKKQGVIQWDPFFLGIKRYTCQTIHMLFCDFQGFPRKKSALFGLVKGSLAQKLPIYERHLSKVKSSRVESSRVESSRVESSRVESSRVESSRIVSSRVESSRVGQVE